MYSKRDKLTVRGVDTLSDRELLVMLLDGSGSEAAAQGVLELCGGDLRSLASYDVDALRMVGELGGAKAARIIAACELGRRVVTTTESQVEVLCSEDVLKIFRPMVKTLRHEECWALHLNAASRLVEIQRVSQGGVLSTTVDCKLVVKRSLELLTTRLILVHNHPSGSVEPSQADIDLTVALRSAVSLFDIDLLDHIIVSSTDAYSFAGNGLFAKM